MITLPGHKLLGLHESFSSELEKLEDNASETSYVKAIKPLYSILDIHTMMGLKVRICVQAHSRAILAKCKRALEPLTQCMWKKGSKFVALGGLRVAYPQDD
jgi:predicted metal-dependent TIM-barrel fold hydrolase